MVIRHAFFLAALSALPAHASPWGQGEGEIYARVAAFQGDVEGLSSSRLDLYAERGFGAGWTATAKYERVSFAGYDEFAANGWRLTGRRSYQLSEKLVASIEGGVLEGEAIGGAAGCQSIGVEARTGLGRSFQTGKKRPRNAFWFLEGAMRAHDDGCQRFRIEAGYGREMIKNGWAITQLWVDQGSENAASQKYQVEYLWRTPVGDLSAGSQIELGGAFEETSVFVALARRF